MILANHTEQSVTNQVPKTQIVYRFAKMLESIRQSGLLEAEDVKIVKIKRPNIGRCGKGEFKTWNRLGEIRISVFQYTSNGSLIEKLITCTSKENENYYSWDSNKKYLSANYVVYDGDYLGYGQDYGRRKRSKDFIKILSEYIETARYRVRHLLELRDEHYRKIDGAIHFLSDNVPTIGGSEINSIKRWMQKQIMAVLNGSWKNPTERMNAYSRITLGMFTTMHHLMDTFPDRLTTFNIEPEIDSFDAGHSYHVADVGLPQYALHDLELKKWLQFKLEEWEMFGAVGKRKTSLYKVEVIEKDKEPRRFAEFLRYAKEQAKYLECDKDDYISYTIDYKDNEDIFTNNLFIKANDFTHRQDYDKHLNMNVSWLYVLDKKRALKTLSGITIFHKVRLD